MKKLIKSKLCILTILSIIMFMAVSLSASSDTSDPEHEKIMTQYISELKILQNRIFRVAQLALDEPPEDVSLTATTNSINNDISKLRQRVLDYSGNIPPTSLKNRDTLLLQNAINDSQNSLYQLTSVSDTSTNLDKLLLFEDYFTYKKSSEEILNNIENIISQY